MIPQINKYLFHILFQNHHYLRNYAEGIEPFAAIGTRKNCSARINNINVTTIRSTGNSPNRAKSIRCICATRTGRKRTTGKGTDLNIPVGIPSNISIITIITHSQAPVKVLDCEQFEKIWNNSATC